MIKPTECLAPNLAGVPGSECVPPLAGRLIKLPARELALSNWSNPRAQDGDPERALRVIVPLLVESAVGLYQPAVCTPTLNRFDLGVLHSEVGPPKPQRVANRRVDSVHRRVGPMVVVPGELSCADNQYAVFLRVLAGFR